MNVRKALLVLMLSIAMCSSLMATGVGNLEIKLPVSGPDSIIYSCAASEYQIWFRNDAPLYAFTIGLHLTTTVPLSYIVEPYGTLPVEAPIIDVFYNPSNAFDLGITVDASQLPDFIFISGTAQNNPLPPSGANPSMALRFQIYVAGQAVDGVCIDNVVHSVSGKWMFFDEAEYAPLYNGLANNSMTDPSAVPACADVLVLPCGSQIFTSVPPTNVTTPFCEPYTFDFDGVHPFLCGQVYFGAAKGIIDIWTGVYRLPPDGGVEPVVDTVTLYADLSCFEVPFVFTINRTNAPPEVNNCRPKLFVQEGTAKAIDYDVSDADTCDTHEWSLTLLSGTPPTFPVSIDPATGVLIVDATGVTTEETFNYQVTSTDASNSAGTDTFQLKTTAGVPGDANSSGTITVSDAALIIMYIFMGGPPPLSEYGADPDCSGGTSISDAVHLVTYIFSGGLAPCGVEP